MTKRKAVTNVSQPNYNQLADIFNTAITANVNILTKDVSLTKTGTGLINIYVVFDVTGNLSLRRTKGATTTSELLNGGTALAAAAAYSFSDIPIAKGESINLQYSGTTPTCLKLNIVEVMAT